VSVTWPPSAGMACHDPVQSNALFALWSAMTFLRIVIAHYLFDLSSAKRNPGRSHSG